MVAVSKADNGTRRSTVLSLPLKLGFPELVVSKGAGVKVYLRQG